MGSFSRLAQSLSQFFLKNGPFFALFLAGFLLSNLLVIGILALAKRFSWYDQPNIRKVHRGQIPRLGGIGFSVAFMVVTAVAVFVFPTIFEDADFRREAVTIFAAAGLIISLGLFDDFKPVRPRDKLIIQSLAACIVFSAGLSFRTINIPLLPINIDMGILSYAVTFIWIIGITNAVNLIDGIDALAGGISVLAAAALSVIFALRGDLSAASLAIILTGSVAGFLILNLPTPCAKIFMGDCGSQFLGFMLAVLPLLGAGSNEAGLPLPYAAALLLIPIGDTFSAILRRIRNGQEIGSPDRQHLHHKLLDLGINVKKINILLWSLQALVGAFVLLAFLFDGWLGFVYFLAPYLIIGLLFAIVHFKQPAALRRPAV